MVPVLPGQSVAEEELKQTVLPVLPGNFVAMVSPLVAVPNGYKSPVPFPSDAQKAWHWQAVALHLLVAADESQAAVRT